MANRIQANRLAAISGPFKQDALLRAFRGTEQLGRLFQIDVELLSEDTNVRFEQVVGQNVTISMELPDGSLRYFNGFVSRFQQLANRGRLAAYTATIVPWLWFLTRNSDCRIWQNKTVPEIIKEVFRDRGFTAFDDSSLTGTYTPWEYCVQYRETDFNFVSRLMEHEGIYYYFLHKEGEHTLVLADSPSGHDHQPGYEKIPYHPRDEAIHERESIWDWVIEQEVQPGRYALTDYDFKMPRKALVSASAIPREHAAADFEVYDYPGEYEEHGDGETYARIRIEELQASFEVARGQSDAQGICTGATFELTDYPREDQNREYLITCATHVYSADAMDSTNGDGAGEPVYSCSFTAIDATQPYRSPRLTPKPLVQGPQTAIVTGPPGEEIHTDEHGRVTVHFHWDRHNKFDQSSSCWIRVSQPWAGQGWGGVSIPRIGQEVIVEFVEGDPDLPIITGRVYNGNNKSPYPLPGGAVISGMRSNTHKGKGYNEFIMDDTAGKELIREHAQFDKDSVIEHDQRHTVKNNRTRNVLVKENVTIGDDQTLAIGGNRNETVAKSESVKISGSRTHLTYMNSSETVGIAKELFIGGAYSINVGGVMNTIVIGAKMEQVGGYRMEAVALKKEESVGRSLSQTVGTDHTLAVTGAQTISIGKSHALKAKDITITAEDKIEIKVGASSITMDKDGFIQISGKTIDIEASSEIGLTAQSKLDMDGGEFTLKSTSGGGEINSTAMLDVKGATVKINS